MPQDAKWHQAPPLWLIALLALVALAVNVHTGAYHEPAPPIARAFFNWLITFAGFIQTGVKFIGELSLAYAVRGITIAWQALKVLRGGLGEVARGVLGGLRNSWHFLDELYGTVLKPAWNKFWRFIDWARVHLERAFGPTLRALRKLRAKILEIYDRFVRPILDTIDVARKVLRVFGALHFAWAKKLDEKLALLEEKIDAPFRLLVRQINEIINLIDRVVTADGLFQRLALIRSIERDIRHVSRAFANWRSRPLTADDYKKLRQRASERTLDDVKRDTAEALLTKTGRYGPLIEEMQTAWRIYLNVP